MHSNLYTNIIFIGMGVEITVYTGKYPETLFILLNIHNFSGFTMNYPGTFFPCTMNEFMEIFYNKYSRKKLGNIKNALYFLCQHALPHLSS